MWVMKTGILIMLDMRHMHSTPITTEHYLHGQIRKAAGQLEDFVMFNLTVC